MSKVNEVNPIAGVACIYNDRIYSLPAPYRHSDVIRAIKLHNPTMKMFKGDQGFVDHKGFFLTRRQGFDLVIGTEYYINPTPHISKHLFSEDVWETPGDWSAPQGSVEYNLYHDVYNDTKRHDLVKIVTLQDHIENGYPLEMLRRNIYIHENVMFTFDDSYMDIRVPTLYSHRFDPLEEIENTVDNLDKTIDKTNIVKQRVQLLLRECDCEHIGFTV